jgi:hypothetical protein
MTFETINKRTWNATKNYCANLIRSGNRWIFRGMARAQWHLLPSLERLLGADSKNYFVELKLISEVERKSHHYLSKEKQPENLVESFGVIQDYGGPTRFLDWTFSYFVAAYFAVEEKQMSDQYAIWAIDYDWLRSKTNEILRREVDKDINIISEKTKKITDNNILLKILCGKFLSVVPIEPYKYNERIKAQNGLFLLASNCEVSFEENFDAYDDRECKQYIRKITIPNTKREEILRELNLMNITADYLYPGLEGFSRSLKFIAEETRNTR